MREIVILLTGCMLMVYTGCILNPSGPGLVDIPESDAHLMALMIERGAVTPDDWPHVLPAMLGDAKTLSEQSMSTPAPVIDIQFDDLPAYPAEPVAGDATSISDLPAGSKAYFLSSSTGNDSNAGDSPATAWKRLSKLNSVLLGPGDRVYLKRGDIWTGEQLHLNGDGTQEHPVLLLSYGSGGRPHIDVGNQKRGIGVIIESPSHWEIWDLHVSDAKLGLYLRYMKQYGNEDVTVRNCLFEDMADFDSNPGMYDYEYAFNSGIWLGGSVEETRYDDPGYQQDLASGRWVVLTGLTISHCTFENNAMGFGTNWYYLGEDMHHVKDLHIHDCRFTRPTAGALALNYIDTAVIERVKIHSRADMEEFFQWGSAGSILFSCQDILFDSCEFSEVGMMPWKSGDGCGIDIDGRNRRITLQNSVFHDNASAGILMLSTSAVNEAYGIDHPITFNRDIHIKNNVFYNNGLTPNNWISQYGGDGWSIKMANSGSSGTIKDNWFLRSPYQYGYLSNDNSRSIYFGIAGGFEQSGNQYGWYDPSVPSKGSAEPLHTQVWNFHCVNDREGFEYYGDWKVNSMQVRGKVFSPSDRSFSEENYIKGAVHGGHGVLVRDQIYIAAEENPFIELRMYATEAMEAKLFYITEEDPVWNDENRARLMSMLQGG